MKEGLPTTLLALSIISIVIIIVSSLLSLAFLYYYRNTPIVAMGQPRMLAIICFGILVIAASSISILILHTSTYPRSIWCDLSLWFQYIGYVTILTMMFCMLYRVHKVMRLRRGQTILPRHAMGPFVATQLVYFGLLMWNTIANPFEVAVTLDGIAYCTIEKKYVWIIPVLKEVLLTLIYISVLTFAWKVRHVSEEIGCSRKVFLVCCFAVIIHAVHSAIFHSVGSAEGIDDTKKYCIQFVAATLCELLMTMAPIGFLILPRMYYVWYERTHGHLPESVTMIGTGQVHVGAGATKAVTTPAKTIVPSSGNQKVEYELAEVDAASGVTEA